MDNIQFYMKVPLPGGGYTNGKIDYTQVPEQLGLAGIDLSGLRVLDVAANDGFWTFWSEQRGSSDVLAIDVDSFDGYDWNWGGPPPNLKFDATSQWTESGAGFKALHKAWKSKAQRRALSVYDLDPDEVGQFDLIFNFGLLYHLRHPLLSLDRTRAVCRGAMILETHIVNNFRSLPASLFYRTDELHTITNWTGPNEAAIVSWLLSAGYRHVFSNRTNTSAPYARRIFIACVSDEWVDKFIWDDRLIHFDDAYQESSRQQTRELLTKPKPPAKKRSLWMKVLRR